jgi:ketosteroid isomerase-like protein
LSWKTFAGLIYARLTFIRRAIIERSNIMKKQLSLILLLLVVIGACLALFAAKKTFAGPNEQESIAGQIIAREKASVEAWRRKDKAFFADFMADDSTYYNSFSPYLDADPKTNFLPKFEQYAEMFKFNDFQMYNPRVQVYGDTAVLTYNSSVSASFNGQPLNYTAKMTAVYVKQGNTWRVVHGHESMNPTPK